MRESFPFRQRALYAFEEVDGVDVCFFGLHVQEYGSEAPSPNTRRVYIAYLASDSLVELSVGNRDDISSPFKLPACLMPDFLRADSLT